MDDEPEELEIQIDPRNGFGTKWKWLVAPKGRAPLKSGEVSGSRDDAYRVASAARDKLQGN